MALANFMSLHFPHGWWRGKRVVELGCGAGAVVGITAGALGASVVCTDMPAIVRQAARNVSVNAGLCGRNVVAAPYLWGVPPADAGLRGKYDVVMGTYTSRWTGVHATRLTFVPVPASSRAAADVIYNNDDVHDALLSSLVVSGACCAVVRWRPLGLASHVAFSPTVAAQALCSASTLLVIGTRLGCVCLVAWGV